LFPLLAGDMVLVGGMLCEMDSGTCVIQTLYGDFELDEEEDAVLIDLINTKMMQRLHGVHQYGVYYYAKHKSNPKERYTRFDHSIGVWALVRRFGGGMQEQVSALLHDASHTVFSHVTDFVYKYDHQKGAYQDTIHKDVLRRGGVGDILSSYGFTLDDVLVKKGFLLKQSYPDICADRLESILHGALLAGFASKELITMILDDLVYVYDEDTARGYWFFRTAGIALVFANIALDMTLYEWGSPGNFLTYFLAAEALKQAKSIKLVNKKEIHDSTDDRIWGRLCRTRDDVIKPLIDSVLNYKRCYEILSSVKHGPDIYRFRPKFRGIDPLVLSSEALVRLSSINHVFKYKYYEAKKLMKSGWRIRLLGPLAGKKFAFPKQGA